MWSERSELNRPLQPSPHLCWRLAAWGSISRYGQEKPEALTQYSEVMLHLDCKGIIVARGKKGGSNFTHCIMFSPLYFHHHHPEVSWWPVGWKTHSMCHQISSLIWLSTLVGCCCLSTSLHWHFLFLFQVNCQTCYLLLSRCHTYCSYGGSGMLFYQMKECCMYPHSIIKTESNLTFSPEDNFFRRVSKIICPRTYMVSCTLCKLQSVILGSKKRNDLTWLMNTDKESSSAMKLSRREDSLEPSSLFLNHPHWC